jgi:hypothetical protein
MACYLIIFTYVQVLCNAEDTFAAFLPLPQKHTSLQTVPNDWNYLVIEVDIGVRLLELEGIGIAGVVVGELWDIDAYILG